LSDEQPKKRRPKKRRRPKAKFKSRAYQRIDAFAKWSKANKPSIGRITVALTERYTRYILGIRAADELTFKGFALDCIGSPTARERHYRRDGAHLHSPAAPHPPAG
jgi:hypothetical protein